MKIKRKEKTTLQTYKAIKRGHVAMSVSKYVLPAVPAVIVGTVNWNDWFKNAGTSLPLAFIGLIIASVSAVLAIYKKDQLEKKGVTPLIIVFLEFLIIGAIFKAISSIANDFGNMFLAVAGGIAASLIDDQIDQKVVMPKVQIYEKLVEENDLDPKLVKKKNKDLKREEKAKRERQAIEEAQDRAVE